MLTLEKENITEMQQAHLVCPLLAVRVSFASSASSMMVVVDGGNGNGRRVMWQNGLRTFPSSVVTCLCKHVTTELGNVRSDKSAFATANPPFTTTG
jgi:hypothetical protein